MASFICTLSLFLLVLANGYFTLPIHDEFLQTSTNLPFDIDVTSEHPHLPRELLMNEATTQFLNTEVKETTDALMGMHMTTSTDDLAESASRESRIWKEMTTFTPSMHPTEEAKADKLGLNNWSMTTIESTTEDEKVHQRDAQPDKETEETTEVEHENDETTENDTTMSGQDQPKNDKREILLDVTTNTLRLTSASSVVDSELTTEQSSSLTKPKKFKGLLKDTKDQEQEKEDEEKKPIESDKTFKKEKEDDTVQPTEDSKNTNAPTAQFDKDGMKNVSNYPKEYMDLDENTALTVTLSGSTDSTTTMKYKKGKKPLDQGKESKPVKEEESNN